MVTIIRKICGLRMTYLIKVCAFYCCVIWKCQAQNLACNREPLTWLQAQEACVIAGGVPTAPRDNVDEEHVWSPEYIYLGETVYGNLDYPDEFVCYFVDYRKSGPPPIGYGSCLDQHHYFCKGWTGWYTAKPVTWPEAAEDCPTFWDGSEAISVRTIPNQLVWMRRAKRLLLTTFSERYETDPWTCIQLSRLDAQTRVSCDIRLKSICQFPANTTLPAGFHTTCKTETDTTTVAPTTVLIEDATTTVQATTTTDILINNSTTEPYITTTEEPTVRDLTTIGIYQPVDNAPGNLVLVIGLVLVGVFLLSATVLACFCWKRRRLMKSLKSTIVTEGNTTCAPVEDQLEADKKNPYSSVHIDQEKESAYYCCENGDVFTSFSILKPYVEKENEYDVTNAQKPVLTDSSDNVYNKLNFKNNTEDSGIFNDDSDSIYNSTIKRGPENPRDSTYNTLSYRTPGFEDDELYGKTPRFDHGDGTYGNLQNKNIESTYDCTSINRNGPRPEKYDANLYGNISTV